MRPLFRTGIALAALFISASALAQTYPTKPVRIMVGASAGGGTDIIARMLAEKFNDAFKGSFVIENRPGASNTIAADLTAKAAPDGHTLLAATNTGQAIAPHLLKLGFDPIKDLTPIALIVTVPNVLAVSNSVPAKDVKELIALMKAKPNDFREFSGYTYGYNPTLLARRVHDAFTMVAMMQSHDKWPAKDIEIIGTDGAAPVALVAGALLGNAISNRAV